MSFVPIYNNFQKAPTSQWFSNPNVPDLVVLRDNFHITTWLMIGVLAQALLCLLPYRNITLVAPVVMFLIYNLTKTALMTFGFIHNPYMDGVTVGRTAPIFPDANGNRPNASGEAEICAIMIGARCNHPLGILAPGFKNTADYLMGMMKQLESESTVHGVLGASQR